jgi:hypothetical protein
LLGSLYLCSLAINLNFYIHCRVCDENMMGIFALNGRGWSTLLILRQEPDLAMVRNEGGKPFIIKALFAMTG